MIDLVGKRFLFLTISLLIIVPGLIAILLGGLKPGIDFTGGTRWEVVPANAAANSTERFKQVLSAAGYTDALVKGATIGTESNITNTIIMDLPGQVAGEEKVQIEDRLVREGLVAGELKTETVTLTPTTSLTPSPEVTGTTTVSGTTTVTATAAVTGTGTTTGTTGTTGT